MTLAEDRRDQVLKICADAGAFVIEDDYARWLSHEKPAPPPLAARDTAGRVVLIASLTKSTAAGFRIGALIGRGPVLERLRSLRLVDDFFVARLVQEAALELVTGPAWTRHLKAVSAALALAATPWPGRSPGTCPNCTWSGFRPGACTSGPGFPMASTTCGSQSGPRPRESSWPRAAPSTRPNHPPPIYGSPTPAPRSRATSTRGSGDWRAA